MWHSQSVILLLCHKQMHSLSGWARIISQRLTSEKARSRPSRTKDIVRIPVQQTETVPMNAHVADSDKEEEIRTRAQPRRHFMNFGEGGRERLRGGRARHVVWRGIRLPALLISTFSSRPSHVDALDVHCRDGRDGAVDGVRCVLVAWIGHWPPGIPTHSRLK